jgi:D-beta-D-heptose 7-phosphate kinase/D-beta-D-heptose 1-phosphate adenosyltransferase
VVSGSLVVVGDALLDRDLDGSAERLAPDAPVPVVEDVTERARPGGAALAAALAAQDGCEVTLVSALGDDSPGRRLRALLADAGVELCDLGLQGETPVKARVRAGGRPLVRLDAGGSRAPCGPLTRAARAAIAAAGGVLVSDYGRGLAAEPSARAAVAELAGDVPVVWDPHPRGPEPTRGVLLVTPNLAEAEKLTGRADPEAAARELAARWGAVNVCVTLGARGALLVAGPGTALAVPAPVGAAGDPCGAGDRFAAAAAARLARGALPMEAVHAGVEAASAFVAAGGAAGWAAGAIARAPASANAAELAAQTRAAGGIVVATGGCFDLLHAGHVRALEAARALGDRLIVCLNSDASVRRTKGPDRPLVGQHDRAAVLRALACVDAVTIFDEDDPRAVLRELRPHIWAKGGDYALSELPEAATLSEWGGRAVLVPYVPGRSTTRLIEEAMTRAR